MKRSAGENRTSYWMTKERQFLLTAYIPEYDDYLTQTNVRDIIFISLLETCGHRGISMGDTEERENTEMTNEEYRERIIAIFVNMDMMDKLRFWYRYISAIEKGEGLILSFVLL